MNKYDIIIIGAGLSGAVLAERYANELKKKVLIIEKRSHIAGNCYDYINSDGILVSKYGAHIFHTSNEEVWKYVQRFSKWSKYQHKVYSKVDDKLVPIPVNIKTVNTIMGTHIKNSEEMSKWLQDNTEHIENPKNSEEVALNRVGKVLYEKLFKNYTKKQWNRLPSELDPSVLARIPVRDNFNERYFDDPYEGIPINGYTKLVESMLSNPLIEVRLNTDFFDIRHELQTYEKLFYTGPIDRFYENKYESLEYRSIEFKFETLLLESFQENSVINYPSEDVAFTRIVEYKKLYDQKADKTTISKEYPTSVGEPYYPIPNEKNHLIFEKYKKLADLEKNIYFVGRLANYKYFNMDQAISNALTLFNQIENGK